MRQGRARSSGSLTVRLSCLRAEGEPQRTDDEHPQNRLAIATAATLIVPNAAHAQRGGMGGMGGRGGRGGGMGGNRQGGGGGQEFSSKDLEKENPITCSSTSAKT